MNHKEICALFPPGCDVSFQDEKCKGRGHVMGVYPSQKGHDNWTILIQYVSLTWYNAIAPEGPYCYRENGYPVIMVDLYNYFHGMTTIDRCNVTRREASVAVQ